MLTCEKRIVSIPNMSESSAPIWVKVMALLTATALGGGYIAYRKISAEKANQTRQSPPPAQQAAAEDAPPGETPAEDRTVMSGSKSGAATIEEIPILRDLMSSSKSGIIIPQEVPKQESNRLLLSGSKSALVFPQEEVQPEDQEKKPRTLLPGSKSTDSILKPLLPEEP